MAPMKRYPLKVLLAAFAIESSSCFLTNNVRRQPSVGLLPVGPRGPLWSSTQDNSCLENNSVFAAYEEWRNKFGKGDYDPVRFANFESNFKVLTTANIKARDKALEDGRAPPQWLELNEFGDYSREEYQAMKKSAQSSTSAPIVGGIKDILGGEGPRSVRRTQVIKPPQSWGTRVGKPTDFTQEPIRSTQIISRNPTGDTAELPKISEQKKKFASKTSISELYGPPSYSASSVEDPTEMETFSYGTQVIRKNEVAPRSTQVISKASLSELYGPPSSPTISMDDPTDTQITSFGTPVIGQNKTPARGTQVILRASSVNELYGPPRSSNDAIEPPNTAFGTQVIRKNETPVRGTQVISKASMTELYSLQKTPIDSNETPNNSWGTQVIRKNETPSRGTQVISRASVNELYAPPSAPVDSKETSNYSWGTQVIRKNETPARGTQVISRASVNGPSATPSAPVDSNQISNNSWGTQVIRKNETPSRGTQVISRASFNELYAPPSAPVDSNETSNYSWGTQVIRKNETPARGTQVISRASVNEPSAPPSTPIDSNETSNNSWGTQVIRKDDTPVRGTQVVSRASVNEPYGPPGSSLGTAEIRGTQVIRKVSEQPSTRGTQVILKAGEQAPPRGTQVVQRITGDIRDQETERGRQDEANRGTYVITPGAKSVRDTNDESWTWGPTTAFPQEPNTQVTGRETMVIETQTLEASETDNSQPTTPPESADVTNGTDVFKSVGERATATIFSLFGGLKTSEEPPNSVSGTVVVQGDNSDSSISGERPQTVLVDKADLQNIAPSIFSFFGGTKKVDTYEEMKAATVEATKTLETAKQKVQSRPTLVIDKNSVDFPRNRVLPEVRRWWQNADGSITGYIYNSENFNDGTKLTTSPLQRAACRSGNVVRSGGKDYLLK